jgi:DNA modification methylase
MVMSIRGTYRLEHGEGGMTLASSLTLHTGDAALVLARLRASPVDCVVTSPPYWGLRDYKVAGQYGHEDSVDEYVASLCRVFDQIARVLSRQGTVWLNLGDSFGGSWGNYVATRSAERSARSSWRQGTHRPPQSRYRAKDLVGVPWRVALALAERGWLLRNAVVWVKSNARPESVRDRVSQRYEMLFLLARSDDHWFATSGEELGDVWRIAGPRASTTHIAPGPVKLARRCIALGTRPGGVVLDPFSGSGTTGLAARMLGHPYVGIDIDPTCHDIARRRIAELDTSSGGERRP